MTRRTVAAVIGDARVSSRGDTEVAEALGNAIVSAGLRLITGGMGGVMESASRGARTSPLHRDGDVIAVLPTYSSDSANEFVEIAICTGMNHARNVVVVASADVVFVVGGKSGTLSEIALAWKLGKPIIAVGDSTGWGGRLAGVAIDDRREDQIYGPLPPAEAVQLALDLLRTPRTRPKEFS